MPQEMIPPDFQMLQTGSQSANAMEDQMVENGLRFADRFGWEAMAIVSLLIFTLYFVWRYGGKVLDAIVDFITETKNQIVLLTQNQSKQADTYSELARSVSALAAAQADCLRETKISNDNLKIILSAMRVCAKSLIEELPEERDDVRLVLRHFLDELEH